MPTTDELAVQNALHDLAAAQPDAPAGRLHHVRRRHRRRRAQRAVAAAAVVVAVLGVALGVGVGARDRQLQPAHRSLPSWALPWPEQRDPAVSQSVLDQAVADWRQIDGRDSQMFTPRRVIWYLARPVVDGREIAVVFEVERDDGEHRLVAGSLDTTAEVAGQNQWGLYDVAAPDPHAATPPVVSFYLPGLGDPVPNWVVLLTDPSIPRAVLRERSTVEVGLDRGFAATEFGPLRRQVTVALEQHSSHEVAVGEVGLAGAPDSQVPALEQAPPLQGVPAGTDVIGPFSGQGDSGMVDMSNTAAGPTTVYSRCYGGASLTVGVDHDGVGPRVSIPCDGQQHSVAGPAVAAAGRDGHTVYVHTDRLAAYWVAVVIR